MYRQLRVMITLLCTTTTTLTLANPLPRLRNNTLHHNPLAIKHPPAYHSLPLRPRNITPKQTYIPHFCTSKNFVGCATPLWEVSTCYDLSLIGVDKLVSSYMIPQPLRCEIYENGGCDVEGMHYAVMAGSEPNLGRRYGGWWNDKIGSVICFDFS